MNPIDLSIIIPAYNEEKTIIELLNKVKSVKWDRKIKCEIIIVNDCSKDNTLKKIREFNLSNNCIIIDNDVNLGKSRSVTKGILRSSGEYVIIQDADLEYNPNDINTLLNICLENKLDFAYGNRFTGKNKLIYKSFYIGNKGVSFFSNIFTFPKLKKLVPDMEVCYKLVKGNIIRDIAMNMRATTNFGFEPEVTARLANYKIDGKHLKFDILPISYFPRTIEQGKKIRWKDGFKAIGEIIRYNLTK